MSSVTTVFLQSMLINIAINFLPILILLLVAYYLLLKVTKRFEKKSEENLLLAQQNSNQMQQLLEKHDARLNHLEKLIREVD